MCSTSISVMEIVELKGLFSIYKSLYPPQMSTEKEGRGGEIR